ncbi:MAG TPA: hypothetical protein VFH72_08855 [Candidatus Baltobacteraceae bacterium]|nr:hypothetical protein [Candidatus Baltobacteraceae bacterium]
MLDTVPSAHRLISDHYARVAPMLVRTFAGIPFVYATFPPSQNGNAKWHGPRTHTRDGVKTVAVATRSGTHAYLELSEANLAYAVDRAHAVELHSWTPCGDSPYRARFGRILLTAEPAENAMLAEGASIVRDLLRAHGLDAIALIAGASGVALYVPFADAPPYAPMRAFLDAICLQAVAQHPQRFTTQPNTHAAGRIHLHAGSNAVGRFSALPYSVRGGAAMHVCAPVTWEELFETPIDAFTVENFPQRLDAVGDLFAQMLSPLASQTFGAAQQPTRMALPSHQKPIEHHGHVLQAALQILQDGVPRDAKQILQEAIAQKLLPPSTLSKYVYTSLLEYIVRTSGHGHRPAIVQDHDRRFRINEPPDNWPALEPPPDPPITPQTQALIDRLAQTVRGSDPAAFELAVCDAFAQLGFRTTHVGGHQNPDGYADAQLGTLGYRVMLECKTGEGDVTNPDAVEASKYREPFNAQYCALIGPGFAEDTELGSELVTHGVSAWTVDDMQRLLRVQSNPYEMLALLKPGFVADVIDTLLWNRVHGETKRLQLVCRYLQDGGWAAQVAAAKQGTPQNAPLLTIDAAMMLVDQRLADEGSDASCTREEVQLAFEYLTSPLVGAAVWSDASRDALVMVSPSNHDKA